MKKIIALIMIGAVCLMCVVSCGKDKDGATAPIDATAEIEAAETVLPEVDEMFTDRDKTSSYTELDGEIVLADAATTTGGIDGVSYTEGTLRISAEGVYQISGTLTDGQICVEAPEDAKIQLVFSGVTITSSDSAALYIKSADKVFVTLEGSNSLSVTGTYVQVDENTVDGAVFSKEDLTFNGTGTLSVNSAEGHGIVCKDDLAFTGGTYTIDATRQGVSANNSIRMTDSTVTVISGGDALHAEHTEDASLGYLYIASGTYHLSADGDGISASSVLKIEGGTFTVTTGGGSNNASSSTGGWGVWGSTTSTATETSAKGYKAASSLILTGGTHTLDTSDDAIHSNGSVYINGGSFEVKSGDDGIHADTSVNIYNGTITVAKSYEGVEGQNVTISGGVTRVVTSDDGINAGGGSDSSSIGGRPGQNNFTSNADCYIRIAGGVLYVNATGDGLDANGSIYVTGGETYVSGPTSSGNGALDYDNTAEITGGVFFAGGSTGMAQNFGSTSTQGALLYSGGTIAAGTTLTVKDSSGTLLGTFIPDKQCQCVVISLPGMAKGEKVTIAAGSSTVTVTMSAIVMSYGTSGGTSAPGGRW